MVVVVVVVVVVVEEASRLTERGRRTNGPGTPPFGVVGTMPWLLLTALAYASLASCMAVTKSMIGGYHANLRHVSNAHAWLDITTMTPNCDGSSCTWFSWTCARRLEATIETIGTSTPSATDGPSMHRVMSWLQLLHPSTPPGWRTQGLGVDLHIHHWHTSYGRHPRPELYAVVLKRWMNWTKLLHFSTPALGGAAYWKGRPLNPLCSGKIGSRLGSASTLTCLGRKYRQWRLRLQAPRHRSSRRRRRKHSQTALQVLRMRLSGPWRLQWIDVLCQCALQGFQRVLQPRVRSLLVKVAPLITTTDVSACSRHNVTVWEHWVLCTRHLSPPLRHPWFRPRYTGPAVGRPYCTCASTPAHHPRSIQAIPIFLGCLEVARLFSVGCSCMDRDPLHDDVLAEALADRDNPTGQASGGMGPDPGPAPLTPMSAVESLAPDADPTEPRQGPPPPMPVCWSPDPGQAPLTPMSAVEGLAPHADPTLAVALLSEGVGGETAPVSGRMGTDGAGPSLAEVPGSHGFASAVPGCFSVCERPGPGYHKDLEWHPCHSGPGDSLRHTAPSSHRSSRLGQPAACRRLAHQG